MPYDIRANISHSIDISLVIRTGLEIITGLKNNIVSKPTAGGHSIVTSDRVSVRLHHPTLRRRPDSRGANETEKRAKVTRAKVTQQKVFKAKSSDVS